MTLQSIVTLSLTAILVENFVLVKYLGVCPFLGGSKKMDAAIGMSMAVTFVMTVSAAAAWAIQTLLLERFNLMFLRLAVFILVIAGLTQLMEMFMKKALPALYAALGTYLPFVTANCAVLGVALISSGGGTNFITSVLYAFFSGAGFSLALLLFASIRARLEFSECPAAFEGFPIALVTAGLLAMTFMGFSGVQIF